MHIIDIRDVEDISGDTKIKFAENSGDEYASHLETHDEGVIKLIDCGMLGEPHVKIKDIDNLIKALQKAKEIWT